MNKKFSLILSVSALILNPGIVMANSLTAALTNCQTEQTCSGTTLFAQDKRIKDTHPDAHKSEN